MVNDPYTLIIALDSNLTATGSLYLDDGKLVHTTQRSIYIQYQLCLKHLIAVANRMHCYR
jgi:hypothetical protein